MWFTANTDVQFPVKFLVDGEYVIPTVATATVRDDVGSIISGFNAFDLTPTSTSVILTLPSVKNLVTSANTFETRYVEINFVYGGLNYQQRDFYRLLPFILLAISPENVRRELGLESSELPDEAIDLNSSYVALLDQLGSVMTDALSAGGAKNQAANQAVVLQTVLDLADSLPFRVPVKFSAEDSTFARMGKFDVGEIKQRFSDRLIRVLEIINGGSDTGKTIFLLSTSTDPITGV